MDRSEIFGFISKQKTAFIASVDDEGYPVMRAMLAPRRIEDGCIYFTTNTSSNKVRHFNANSKASVYFYSRGMVKYQGVCITGEMEVCTDQPTKDSIWRSGDRMFYKQGVTDPDYCVLKFRCIKAEVYSDLKIETVEF